jgi:large subunit ribosomal protein L29
MATATELRELKTEEMKARAQELQIARFDLKTKHNTGLLDSTAELLKNRRDRARCLTLVREAELGIVRQAKVAKKPRAKAEGETAGAEKKAKKAKKS